MRTEPEEAASPARPAWYMLAILILIYIMGSVDRAVPSVVVEPLKHDFGLSDAQIGMLGGFAYSVPYALAALPGGWLLDRLDRRRFLALTTAVWSVLTMAGGVATSFTMLIFARMGVGAAEAPASPGSLSLIGDLFPPQKRGTAISLYYAGTAAGQFITFVIGGWLLIHFGWRSLFLIAGVPGLVLAALLMFTCREPVRGSFDRRVAGAPTSISFFAALKHIVASRPLLHGIMGNMLSSGVQFSVMVWTVSFLVRVHGLSNQRAAIWVGLGVGLMQTIGSISVGPLADRFARGDSARLALVPMTFAIGAALSGIAMAMAPTLIGSIACMALFGMIVGGLVGPSYATLVSLTPSNIRGSILSVAKLISILVGNGVLTWFTGKLSDVIGGTSSIRWALAATLLFHFWAAFHFWMAHRASREAVSVSDPEIAPLVS